MNWACSHYEEPGAYRVGDNDPFTHAILRENILRMVRRDRNHPSMAIYSMINEGAEVRCGAALALHEKEHDRRRTPLTPPG